MRVSVLSPLFPSLSYPDSVNPNQSFFYGQESFMSVQTRMKDFQALGQASRPPERRSGSSKNLSFFLYGGTFWFRSGSVSDTESGSIDPMESSFNPDPKHWYITVFPRACQCQCLLSYIWINVASDLPVLPLRPTSLFPSRSCLCEVKPLRVILLWSGTPLKGIFSKTIKTKAVLSLHAHCATG